MSEPPAIDAVPSSGPAPSDRLWEIFWRALELPLEGQDAFLAEACGDDARLLHQVRAMLRVHRSAPDFLETPAALAVEDLLADTLVRAGEGGEAHVRGAAAAAAAAAMALRMPERIGKFRIRRVIGHGGMGVVYEAAQDRPARTVALKVIRPEVTTPEHIRRFEYEADILGRLQHPFIAQVYEAGTEETEYGRQPYFAMELIDGQPLLEYAESRQIDARERLELIVRICEAVHHAHQQGVVHRDLKPANILVTADGQPKILDFGVARLATSEVDVITQATEHGQLLGTLPYMSPEQVGGDPRDVDIRSDVYALGVVMYEMLTGRLPYQIRGGMIFEAMRIIREDPPQPLSSINRIYRGDVETIAGKALQKDKRDRYQSAAELGADIRRHLNNELIEARPATTLEQAVKFARRNRELVGGVTASFLLILLGLISTLWMAKIADAERDSAVVQQTVANQERLEAETQRAIAEAQREEAEFQAYTADLAAASAELELGRPVLARKRLRRTPEHLRHWEWQFLMGRTDDSIATPLAIEGGILHHIGLLPSRNAYAVAGEIPGGAMQVRDMDSNELLHELRASNGRPVLLAVDPLERYIACTPDGRRIEVRRTDDWSVVWEHTVTAGTIRAFTFSENGARLVAGVAPDMHHIGSSEIIAWNTENWNAEPAWRRSLDWLYTFAIDPTEKYVVSAAGEDVMVVSVATGESTVHKDIHRLRVYRMRFNRDGTRLLTLSFDGTARLWSMPDMTLLHEYGPFGTFVIEGCFLANGTQVAIGVADGGIRIADIETGELISTLHGHEAHVTGIAEDTRDGLLWSCSTDGTVHVWSREYLSGPRAIQTDVANPYFADFVPGTDLIAHAGGNAEVRLYNATDHQHVTDMIGHTSEFAGLDVTGAPGQVVTSSTDGTLRVWDIATVSDIDVPCKSDSDLVGPIDVDPSGRRVVFGFLASRRYEVVDLDETGRLDAEPVFVLDNQPGRGYAVCFSRDGQRIATSGNDMIVRLWNATDGSLIRELKGAGSACLALAFVNEDRTLYAVNQNGQLVRWEVEGDAPARVIEAHGSAGSAIAVHPSGQRMATSAADGTVKFWHVERGVELLTLRDHKAIVYDINFDADGDRLLSTSFDGMLRIWDTNSLSDHYARREGLNRARRIVADDPDFAGVLEGRRDLDSWIDGVVAAAARDAVPVELLEVAAFEAMVAVRGQHRREVAIAALPIADAAPSLWITPEAARKAIEMDEDLAPEVRAFAARRAALRRAHPLFVFQSSLDVLGRSDLESGHYAVALEVAARYREGTDVSLQRTFASVEAAALYRLGRTEEAITRFLELEARQAAANPGAAHALGAADLAFLSLAHKRLGDEEEARDRLVQARAALAATVDARWTPFARAIVAEAEAMEANHPAVREVTGSQP